MRIISQLGMDFPYDKIIVFIDDNCVKCKPVSDMSAMYYLLGQYDTEERAQEVFNEFHDYISYKYEQKCFYMPDK